LKKSKLNSSHFSEFELIKHFTKPSKKKKNRTILVPSGDDAFVGKIGSQIVVITTDILTENTDFKLKWYKTFYFLKNFKLSYRQLGIKLARINLSDIFSMGKVLPLWAVGNFLLNNKITKNNVLEIFFGVRDELKKFNCEIIGGDISKSKEISFSLTLVGILKSKKVLCRNSFKIGDYIGVTGTLGDAVAGLKILQNPKKWFFNKKICRYLTQRHLYPKINYKTINRLMPYLTSLTDISDGLYKSLELIVQSRKDVVVEIDSDSIPVSKELKLFCKNDPNEYKKIAISGGEDYEFLFTIKPKFLYKLKNIKNVHIIGKIKKSSKTKNRIVITNLQKNLCFKSFDHFVK
jgi:thiamine-monophosphate kinase